MSSSITKGKIVILDDEPDVCESLEKLFKGEGYEAFGTQKINEAMEYLEKEKVNWAIVDIQMPPESEELGRLYDFGRTYGVKVILDMRAKYPDLNILAFTAIYNPEIHQRIRDAGKSTGKGKIDISTKPAYFDNLLEKVK